MTNKKQLTYGITAALAVTIIMVIGVAPIIAFNQAYA